jgi:adenylosuccinate synthase
MINVVTQLFMMKADILNIFKKIKAYMPYELPDGTRVDRLTYELNTQDANPIHKTVLGWHTSFAEVNDYNQFPNTLQDYMKLLEDELGVSIKIVSVGPDRKQTILR